MIKTKKLLAAAIIPVLMPFHAYSQEAAAVVAQSEKSNSEKVSAFGGKIWEQAKKALRNASIRRQVNAPTIELAQGLNLGAYYKIESTPSIAGKYSGIDIWDVNLAAYPQLFGISMPSGVGAGASISRQVTYIQQFASQEDSLLRVPYDPVTKLPTKSSIFFEKKKNIFSGEVEQVLKPGDFIGYRAPMTFSLGKGFSSIAAGHFGFSAGLSYAITGEFDIHVFVMKDNLVRVKLLATKAKSKGASVGISLLGFNGIGEMIINRLIDTNLLSMYFNKSNSDLFVADYIFNLNKQESRDMYDQIIGSKLHIFSLDVLKKQILAANPFATDQVIHKRLIADLGDLNSLATADLDKPYMDRSVIKLLNAHNESESRSSGQRVSLLRVLKIDNSETRTGSKITIYANNDDSIKSKFILDSYSANNSFSFLIWGDKYNATNSLLTRTDLDGKPVEFIGLQNSRIREDKIMRLSEFNGLMNRLQKMLPAVIFEQLEKPKWDFSKNAESVYLQQDITFNQGLFKLNSNVSEDSIRAVLIEILKNYGKLKAKPMGAKEYSSAEERDPVMEAFNRGNYVEAYKDDELVMIPKKLAVALNSAYSFDERYAEFSHLYEKIPLFAEISATLLLKTLPEKDLEKIVVVNLAMSAKKQKPIATGYPKIETIISQNLFKEILAQNGHINDQSYNLRNYIKEDGTLYSIDEIMIEKSK